MEDIIRTNNKDTDEVDKVFKFSKLHKESLKQTDDWYVDKIKVFYCKKCQWHLLNFSQDFCYCQYCGKKMIKRTYEELLK